MKKIFFVTARLPYPTSSGRKNVMYNYCKILNRKYGYEVVVASFLEHGDSIDPKPDFISKVYPLTNISSKTKISNLLKYTLLQKSYPMQVSLFWDENIDKQIADILENEKPDIAMADMVRTTEYLKNYNGFKIADLDDMLSIRYKRQMDVDIAYLNPYGAYLYSLPNLLQKILELPICKKMILVNEIKLLQKYERKICKSYDKTVFVAEREAKILNELVDFDKAVSIPLGVDVDYYGKYYKRFTPENNSVVFLGAMSVSHNEAGVVYFIKHILPYIVDEIQDVKFYVIGGGVTDRLKALASNNIIFVGRVEDVRSYVGKCKVFVCPLIFGSGIKTKNLEAMAMGVPVVTTTIGAENIHAADGEDWLVADDEKEFAKMVISVIKQPDLHESLQKNAYNFVVKNFTWKVAEEKFKEILR